MKAALAAPLAAVMIVAAGCGSTGSTSQVSARRAPVRHGAGPAIRYESVGVAVTPAPARFRPAVSRSAVLALFRREGQAPPFATGKPAVHLRTVNDAYPAWVITFRHRWCTAVSIYDLRARIWTWNFANCLHRGKPATCEGDCTPANQPALDAAASYAEHVAGGAHVFSGVVVDDDSNTVIVHLAHAPESILANLRARHPGIYVIHNDAPRTLRDVRRIADDIDPVTLKAQGIHLVEWGPTQDGHLQVGVSSDVASAQAFFDAKYGKGVARVVHAEPAVAT